MKPLSFKELNQLVSDMSMKKSVFTTAEAKSCLGVSQTEWFILKRYIKPSKIKGKWSVKSVLRLKYHMDNPEEIEQDQDVISQKTNLSSIQKQGVYFLISSSKVVYVGSSKDCLFRIMTHRNNKAFDFDSFHIIEIKQSKKMLELEREYIARLMPQYNTSSNPRYMGDDRKTKLGE